MSIDVTGFPFCCTAKVLHGFGGTPTAQSGTGSLLTYKAYREQLASLEESNRRYGYAVLVVTLNSDQKKADKVLLERGYIASPWMSKPNHPDKKLRLYYLPLNPLEPEVTE